MTKTERRVRAHSTLEGAHLRVAQECTRDLLRWCPYVQCVALTGSLASGGFQDGDDIDFDLFVEDGTKYICYLMGTLLGLRYAWRFRNRNLHPHHATPFLPKITCLNVVWSESETRPFARRDVAMAYELLRCLPLGGAERFREVLRDNRWLEEHFPQLYEQKWSRLGGLGDRNPVGRFMAALRRFPRALCVLEAASRRGAWGLYRLVQWTRRNDSEAVRRMAFLRDVKYPYEAFQD